MTRNFDTMHIPFNKDRRPAGSKACLFTRNIAKIGAKLLSDLTSTLTPCTTHVSQTTCAYAPPALGAAYCLSLSGLQQQMSRQIHGCLLYHQVRDTDARLILDVYVVLHQLCRSTVGTWPHDESCMQKHVKSFFYILHDLSAFPKTFSKTPMHYCACVDAWSWPMGVDAMCNGYMCH